MIRSLALTTACLLTVACAAQVRTANRLDLETSPAVNQLRDATRRYQTLDSAVAAGYPREVRDCLVHEHHGAMGYHHVNRGYLDAVLDVTRPEILLYERTPKGEYRLNGVEFILPYTRYARDSAPPVFMGQTLRREDNLKFWYLHVWAWNENPDGIFANFHPRVTCPDSARKVFAPFEAVP
jgi:hypothetical protein